jgi:hypothetical protein
MARGRYDAQKAAEWERSAQQHADVRCGVPADLVGEVDSVPSTGRLASNRCGGWCDAPL